MKKFEIAIIGGGPAGVMCAIQAAKNPNNFIYIVEQKELLSTILQTGGGRCNIANYELNNKQLASNYPRGEKFLLSPFSQFSVKETMDFFKEIGLPLKVLDNNRVFPKTECSKDVQRVLTEQVNSMSNIKIVKARVFNISLIGSKYILDCLNKHLEVDAIVFATGSNPSGYRLAASAGVSLIQAKPSLCPLLIREKHFHSIPGVSVQNVEIKVFWDKKQIHKTSGDLLFTHTSLSGPVILEVSSLCATLDISSETPLLLEVNFIHENFEKFRDKFKQEIKKNTKKNILNICSKFLSRYVSLILLEECNISPETKASDLTKIRLNELLQLFTNYTFHVTGRDAATAIVTAGGISLKDVDNKTMQFKKHPNIYFCGEILDIDGLCGGFNLQNCWTTGFVAGNALRNLND